MWIAKTSFSDGILVVIFATMLFLLLLGMVIVVRWIFRSITGRTEPESVVLVFSNNTSEDEIESEDASDEFEVLRKFSCYLHTRLRENRLGYCADFSCEGEEMLVFFEGPDANRIWGMINNEAADMAPAIPLRVILKRSKNKGGERLIEAISWQRASVLMPLPDFEMPAIPETVLRLSRYAEVMTLAGIAGLFLWGVCRNWLNLSEDAFRETTLGNYSAWFIGSILVVGLALNWISSLKLRQCEREAGFSVGDSATSAVLKYVMLLVILIFGLVFVFTAGES